MKLERDVLKSELESQDVTADAIVVEGKVHRRVLNSAQTYMTAAGPVIVTRGLYKDRTDESARAIVPLDRKLGIVDGFWTPLAAQQASWVVTQMTPGKAEELFERVGNMQPSKASLDRLPKEVSRQWEKGRELHEEALREACHVPEGTKLVAVSLDGVMAPMADGGRTEKREKTAGEGKLTRGPAGYREIGCATLSFCDAKGEMLSAIRIARAPEEGKSTLKKQLQAELLVVLAKNPKLKMVKIADGAEDNWTYLSVLLPEAPEILDYFHACEQLHGAVAAAYGDGTREARQRFDRLKEVLRDDDDGVTQVIASLKYLQKRHARSAAISGPLAYFRRHRKRMQYASFKAAGYPIGSGVVEAACKTLVTQRLKLSGMRWSMEGAQAILTPRGWDQSDRFDEAWALLAATYQTQVTLLSNVIPLRPN